MILEIRNYFDALRQSVTPDIKHFICGCDEQSLREAIAKFDSAYMFADFGAFTSSLDRANRIEDSFEIGLTIAEPLGSRAITWSEILEIQQQCFDGISAIRSAMISSGRDHPLMKRLSPSHSILPFIAPDIARSIGFTLTFQLKAFDLLNAK